MTASKIGVSVYEGHDLRYWEKVRTARLVVGGLFGLIGLLWAAGAPFHAN